MTTPTPWSIENAVALLVVHESVDGVPVWIDAGFAESVQVGLAGGGGVTVTLAEHVTVLPPPFAVSV